MVGIPSDYERKFADWIKVCQNEDEADTVVITSPEALGDTYLEVIESLNRLADSGLTLTIVPRAKRGDR